MPQGLPPRRAPSREFHRRANAGWCAASRPYTDYFPPAFPSVERVHVRAGSLKQTWYRGRTAPQATACRRERADIPDEDAG
jgi:hypothetical protein